MPLTLTDIVNGAFVKLGVPTVGSIDDDIASARSAKVRWPAVRAHLLRLHLWKFAKSRPVVLSPAGTADNSDFSYYFNFPTECIRLCDLSEEQFLVEGRTILANTDTLVVRYIQDIEDTTKYDACFAELCSTYLAADLAVQLTKEIALKESLQEEVLKLLKLAKSIDSTESEPQCIDATLFLQSRFAGPTECCDGSSKQVSFSSAAASSLAQDACNCPVFGFEGTTSAAGLVPAPGAATGSRRVLYSDVGWDTAPSGGGSGGVVPSGTGFTHNTGGVQDGASKQVDLNSSDVTNKLPYSKFQDVSATDKLLGRSTAGAGVVEEITCTAAGRAFIDDADAAAQRTTLGLGTLATASTVNLSSQATGTLQAAQEPAHTGDVTNSAGSLALTIANGAVTYAKMQNVSATSRFLGRITAGAGSPEELTGTQATTLLDVATSALKGLAPASGGGTSNFLRADLTWAAPPGGSSPLTTEGDIFYYTSGASARLPVGALGSLLGSDGTDPFYLHPANCAWYYDDFDASTSAPYAMGWLSAGVNATAMINGEGNRVGIIQISTGTVATNARTFFRGGGTSSTSPILLGSGRAVFEFWFRIPTLSNGTDRFTIKVGLLNSNTSSAPTNGVWFEYIDSVNSGQWTANCKSTAGATTTINTTNAPVANTWYKARVDINAAASQVDFFIDGTNVGTASTAANIPSGTGRSVTPMFGIYKSVGTADRVLDCDLSFGLYKFSSTR